jgi:hypothetical protein
MAARHLSESQLKAMRSLDATDEYTSYRQPAKRTGDSLVRYGYCSVNDAGVYTLTPNGLASIRAYVKRSGNGPESLKSLLRF